MNIWAILYLIFCIGAFIYSFRMENAVYRRCFQISAMSSLILYALYFIFAWSLGKL
ncbi:MAG: hypothetical protein Q4D21_07010 [Phascolarctobacterium sp.]|nr:hypothetical protein [Phascolarctobacterium sp.]